jgi:hypothetical protein
MIHFNALSGLDVNCQAFLWGVSRMFYFTCAYGYYEEYGIDRCEKWQSQVEKNRAFVWTII